LSNVAKVELALGRRDEALRQYTESLELRRRLIRDYEETPAALRDLVVALGSVGRLACQIDQRSVGSARFKEAEEVLSRLRERFPGASEGIEVASWLGDAKAACQ
jgi:hypothetical protein